MSVESTSNRILASPDQVPASNNLPSVLDGEKIDKVSKSVYLEILKAYKPGRVFLSLFWAGALASGILLLLHPPSWSVLALHAIGVSAQAISKATIGIGAGMAAFGGVGAVYNLVKGNAKVEFLISSSLRGALVGNYDKIKIKDSQATIYLGALPNDQYKDIIELKNLGVKAVLSINEGWELSEFGASKPYSKQEYNNEGIENEQIIADDHKPLTVEQMSRASAFIKRWVDEGLTIYIHCRAGKGRSATGLAAYLIEHCGKQPKEAVQIIKGSRPKATVGKKIAALEAYSAHVRPPPRVNPPVS